jgi:CoA:oxalate CoA-transferase
MAQRDRFQQQRTIRRVRDRMLGEFDLPGFPLRFSAFPGSLELQAPTLGEHNEAVLTGLLGYPTERVRELERRSVLHSAPH